MTNPTDATGKMETTETAKRIAAPQKRNLSPAPFAWRGAKYRFLGIAIALAGVAVLLTSCVPSLFPYFTEKDLVFEPKLVGEWNLMDSRSSDAGVNLKTGPLEFKEVAKAGQRFYRIIQGSADKKSEFDAHLFKVKSELFLDLQPVASTSGEGLASLLAVHGHFIGHIAQIEPELKMRLISLPGLAHCLQTDSNAISCVPIKEGDEDFGRIVITSQTPDLQKFVMKYLYDGMLFGFTNTYSRKGGSAKERSSRERSIEEKNKRIAEIDRRVAEIDRRTAEIDQENARLKQHENQGNSALSESERRIEELKAQLRALDAEEAEAREKVKATAGPLLEKAVTGQSAPK